MSKKMKMTVLMAGQYDIVNGSKIDFRLDQEKHLYIAECKGKEIGRASCRERVSSPV